MRLVPLVRRQVTAVQAIAHAGTLASQAGAIASDAIQAAPKGLQGGRVDLAASTRAADVLTRGVKIGSQARQMLSDAPHSWLVGPVAGALDEATTEIDSAVNGLEAAQTGLAALPSLLGANGQKRYLIAFANLAELRGSGGFIGYFAVVATSGGRLQLLADQGRPTTALPPLAQIPLDVPGWYRAAYARYGALREWQEANMGVDFPTVGSAIVQGASAAIGPLDGVVQIDPIGISALLKLVGPVKVASWPVPISSDNVSSVTQHEQYIRFPQDENKRTIFMKDLIDAVFSRLLAAPDAVTRSALADLGAATAGGHVRFFSKNEADQQALLDLGVAGSVSGPNNATDVLGLASANGSGSKIDWFLRRSITYRVELRPDDDLAITRLFVRLTNDAPPSGLPRYIIGTSSTGLPLGTDRQIVVLLRSPSDEVGGVEVGGQRPALARSIEDVLRTYHLGAVIPPKSQTDISVTSTVRGAMIGSGSHRTYRLHVLSQPVITPDTIDIAVAAPKGWKLDGPATLAAQLSSDTVFEVRLHRTLRARLVDAVFLNPWRLLRRFI